MIEMENANPYGSLSEERLKAFEDAIGIVLPMDYREFLKQTNGGRPVPNGFWIVEGRDGSQVYQFYGLHDGLRWFSIDGYIGEDRHGIPQGLLPIGDDGVGNILCIGISEDLKGAIYFVDHEIHPSGHPDSWKGITSVGESFSEFLAGLQSSMETYKVK